MKQLIKKIIRLSKRYAMLANPYKQKQCCLCNHKVSGFLAHQGGWKNSPALMRALNMIGSDIDNFACPVCYSHDRERHQWLYWQATNLLSAMQGAAILHFAPEPHLATRIAALKPLHYVKADLYPTAPDIQKVDLLTMPFDDKTFDFLIANHVLEHVTDVKQALSEIHRVLKPNGWAILQTPYSACLQYTWEDAGIQTEYQRLVAYGQEDHVRLYGQDIFQIIEAAGFTSHTGTHSELLKDISANHYGVNRQEPFMLFTKK